MTLVSFIKKSNLRPSHNIKKNIYQAISKLALFQSAITPALYHPKSRFTHRRKVDVCPTLTIQLGG